MYNSRDSSCQWEIFYDKTVSDLLFHDYANATYITMSDVYGTFDNAYLLQVSIL